MRFFRILGGIILVALAVGLAGSIFQTGYLAGVAADGGVAPVVVAPGYGWGPGWGFGGGLFHFLGTLFVIVLFVGLLRAIFGGGRRHGWSSGPRGGWGPGEGDGHHRFGSWEDRAREAHDEWHRRQAAGGTDSSSTPGATGSPGTPPGGGA
jgi:hypothetical protein